MWFVFGFRRRPRNGAAGKAAGPKSFPAPSFPLFFFPRCGTAARLLLHDRAGSRPGVLPRRALGAPASGGRHRLAKPLTSKRPRATVTAKLTMSSGYPATTSSTHRARRAANSSPGPISPSCAAGLAQPGASAGPVHAARHPDGARGFHSLHSGREGHELR